MEREGRLPDPLVACVGGGSNAIGLFHPVPRRCRRSRMLRRRSGGRGHRDRHARRHAHRRARPACCTAPAPICCRTTTARSSKRIRSRPASTIPASGPSTPGCTISAASTTSRRPTRKRSTRSSCCAELEGIIPALEPAHALAHVAQDRAASCRKDKLIVDRTSAGRGDKDIFTVAEALGVKL